MTELIMGKIEEDIVQVNQILAEELTDRSPIFDDFIRPLAEAHGKQLRARLCLHIALSGTSDPVQRHWIAGAIEFLHLATLIHDDVLDEAELRRGISPIHQREGNKAAILSGDYLFAKAFYMISKAENTQYLRIFTRVIVSLVEGEFLQMEDVGSVDQDTARYLLKTQKKTADLIEVATELGARLGGYTEDEVYHFKAYGQALGMLFQITDDYMDLTASEEQAGKPVGNDLREGVLTYPILSIKTQENEAFLEREVAAIMNGQSPDTLVQYITEQGGLLHTMELAKTYEAKAKAALDALPLFAGKEILYNNITALMYRTR